jgi:NADP-dependent 3-hydroxy acid dehydrogenase YdfG
MTRFENQVVCITGASSGLGLAMARVFFEQGANLVLAARRLDRLESIAKGFTTQSQRAFAIQVDVSKDGEVEKAVALAVEKFGRLDVMVANAGFGVTGEVEKLSLDDFRRQFETNIFGVLRSVRAAIPELKKTQGRIGITGSVNGIISLAGNAPYAMSKFAVRALSDTLALELAESGVSVTHLAPGFVESEIRRVDNEGKLRDFTPDPLPAWLPMKADKAAREMVNSLYLRRRETIITGHGKAVVWVNRHFPEIAHSLLRATGIRARKE